MHGLRRPSGRGRAKLEIMPRYAERDGHERLQAGVVQTRLATDGDWPASGLRARLECRRRCRTRRAASAVAVGAVVAASGVGGSQPANGTPRRDRCAEESSRTIKVNRFERVFHSSIFSAVYVCDRGTGARSALGEEDQSFLRHTLVLSGHVAVGVAIGGGIAEDNIPRTPENALTILMRIVMPRDRQRSYIVPAVTISNAEDPDDRRAVFVPRLLSAPNQTVVLTTCTLALEPHLGCAQDPRIKVIAVPVRSYYADTKKRTIPSTTKPVVLAEGSGIDPRSLRLSSTGRTAAWTQDGRRRTATVANRQVRRQQLPARTHVSPARGSEASRWALVRLHESYGIA